MIKFNFNIFAAISSRHQKMNYHNLVPDDAEMLKQWVEDDSIQ